MTLTQEITLDIYEQPYFKYVNAKQMDNVSRILIITLTSNGAEMKPDPSDVAVFRALKPDGTSVLNPASIGEDGKITVALTDQTLAAPGNVEADVSVKHGEEVLSSVTMYIQVTRAPLNAKQIKSENEFLLLLDAKDAAEAAAKRAETAAEQTAEDKQTTSELTEQAGESAAKAAASEREAIEAAKSAAADKEATAADKLAAEDYATMAKSYAQGNTGSREGEDVDNTTYYYEQSKRIAQGLQGAIQPHGSIRFEDLSGTDKQPGWMYNVTDAFTTDDTFVEGAGHAYPPGTNVYCTADMLWDCLPGVMVTSVRGEAEPVGRQGDVVITPANIGAYKKSEVDAKIEAAKSRVYTVTVPASGWQPSTATWPEAGLAAKWENTVSVPGMTPEVTLAPGNIAFAGGSLAESQRWRWINTDTDTITVYSDRATAPAADYTWTITEVR